MKRNIFVSLALGVVFLFGSSVPASALELVRLPTVGAISPTIVTADAPMVYSAQYSNSGSGGVTQCRLNENGNIIWTSAVFAPNTMDGVVSVTESFAAGAHNLQFQCVDNANNWGSGPQTTVMAYADTVPPTVGAVSPTTVGIGASASFSTTYADSGTGVKQCRLNINGNIAWTSAVFAPNTYSDTVSVVQSLAAGKNILQFQCLDNAGNWGYGQQTTVNVSSSSQPTNGIPYGTLVKLACPAKAAADHPCKAVYYFGADGKRHAFPNSKVYFTWYSNFNSVQEVSDTQMASIPLGSNVRYRPGVRMVKFTTLPKVYAVGGNGTLRWITTEALASAFYTADWNKHIDDIPDTFYSDYNIIGDITDVSQFNPVGETNTAPNIDSDL